MRQLLYDEISVSDMEKVRAHLAEHAMPGPINDIYFVEFPEDLLEGDQRTHEACAPFVFAIETGQNWFKTELLVRSRNTLRCSCVQYAGKEQTDFIFRFNERLIEQCGIMT